MLFSKTNTRNLLKNSLKVAISDLQSADFEFTAYDILRSINNVLFSYCFFSSILLRMRINWVKMNIKDDISGGPVPLTPADRTMINTIIVELETFSNNY